MTTTKDNLSLSSLSMLGKSVTRLRSSGSVSNKISALSTTLNTLSSNAINEEVQDISNITKYENNDTSNTNNNSNSYNNNSFDGQHSHSNVSDEDGDSYITVYEAVTQTNPIPIIPKYDASTITEVLDENDVGPLITIPMEELREIKQHKSILTKLKISESKSLELIKNVCNDAKLALKIDEHDPINNLSEGIVLHSKLFEHALYLMEKQNRKNNQLENRLTLVENEFKTKEKLLTTKIKTMQSDLNHEKSLLEDFKFTTNQENKFKVQKYDDQDDLVKALNNKIISLQNHNDKLNEEILQFPRREESIRAKFESELRLKNIEFSKKDAERRHLKEEMTSLLYWRNRVDALEAEIAQLKLKQISLNAQKARGVYGAEKESNKLANKLNKELLGDGNFHDADDDEDFERNNNSGESSNHSRSSSTSDDDNNNDKENVTDKQKSSSSPVHKKGAKALVDRLHRQLESRDKQMAILRGRLANVYANPLLNAREPEGDDVDDDNDEDDNQPKSKFREQLGKFDERDPYLGFESDFEFSDEEWSRIKNGLQPRSEYLSDNEEEKKEKHAKKVQSLRDTIKQERAQQSIYISNNNNSSSNSSNSNSNSSKLRRSSDVPFNQNLSPVDENNNSNSKSSERGKISLFKLEQPVVSYADAFGLYYQNDNNNGRAQSAGSVVDKKNRILNPNLERQARLRFAEVRANKSFSKNYNNNKEKERGKGKTKGKGKGKGKGKTQTTKSIKSKSNSKFQAWQG